MPRDNNKLMVELMPCPFCGSEAACDKNDEESGEDGFYVMCVLVACGAIIDSCESPIEAINRWNKRYE